VVQLVGPKEGTIVGTRPQPPEPKTRLVVYPALLQRDKFEPVLQKLTEIGAAAIVPVLTARCLVREPADDQRQARWRAILREAADGAEHAGAHLITLGPRVLRTETASPLLAALVLYELGDLSSGHSDDA